MREIKNREIKLKNEKAKARKLEKELLLNHQIVNTSVSREIAMTGYQKRPMM